MTISSGSELVPSRHFVERGDRLAQRAHLLRRSTCRRRGLSARPQLRATARLTRRKDPRRDTCQGPDQSEIRSLTVNRPGRRYGSAEVELGAKLDPEMVPLALEPHATGVIAAQASTMALAVPPKRCRLPVRSSPLRTSRHPDQAAVARQLAACAVRRAHWHGEGPAGGPSRASRVRRARPGWRRARLRPRRGCARH